MSFPIAIRLLEQYKQGVLKQLMVIATNDATDSSRNAPTKRHHVLKKETDYKRVKAILIAIEEEIKILDGI